MLVMIHSLVVLESPGMWFSLKINISFHHLLTHHLPLYLLCHTFQILPQLWNSSSLVLCMKDIVQLILVPFMIPAHERNKFTTQSVKCAFLGYAITQKGYACYDPQSRHIRISRNVVFFENLYFFSIVYWPTIFLFISYATLFRFFHNCGTVQASFCVWKTSSSWS